MSMPVLDDEFNFNDINLDFLESPPRSTRVVEPMAKIQHGTVPPFLSPSKLFSEGQEYHRTQSQLQCNKPRHSVLELSKRIADVDTLVCQIRKTERERDDLRKQLAEFHQSAKEVQSLYANEKQKHIQEKSRNEELVRRCQGLDTNLTAKTLEADQLQAQLDSLKGPIEYNEMAVKYLRLVQRMEEQLHWTEQATVKDLQKYCKEKCLKIPPIIQRSPRKRKASAVKIDAQIQCNIALKAAEQKREMQDQSTQNEKISTRNQGCQHIGTTTTRSTTTACFFKYHDVGVNCNLLDFNYALSEMLNDIRSWSTNTSPLSPIADLNANTDDISPIQLNTTNSKVSLAPPSNPLPPIELKTAGTCTMLCNVQRYIDYAAQLPSIKRSDSRPPSRVMLEAVKDENTTQSTTTSPSVLDALNNQVPSIPNLFPSAFDELWQIFGHMLYGLLHRRSGNSAPFTHQTVPPNSITNQQEFYNWLQTLYLDINSEERTQQIRNPDTRGVRIERSTTVDTNREGSITTENLSDHHAQNRNVASPLNFSNAAPVKCTSSAQYLFKPKAQRSGNNHALDEVPQTYYSERHSIGTSPIRCITSSPICSEINVIKENSIDHCLKKGIDSTCESNVENRTPSAFTSPKSTTIKDTAISELSETAEKILELFPSVNNRNTTLESLEKLLHKSWKNSKKKNIEKRKSKRLSKSLLNAESETAVDFISKLNSFQNKQINTISDGNESQLDPTETHQKNTTINKKERVVLNRKKQEIRIRELFGSDTDSNDEDMKFNKTLASHNRKENDEEMQKKNMFQMGSISRENIMELNQSNSTRQTESKGDNDEKTNKRANIIECSTKTEKQENISNVPNTKQRICNQKTLFNSTFKGGNENVEKIKQNNFEIQKRDDSIRNEQDVLQYTSENLRSISSDGISTENDIEITKMDANIEKESNEQQRQCERINKCREVNIKHTQKDVSVQPNPDTKGSSKKIQPSVKQLDVEKFQSPDGNEELFLSPKETSSKIMQTLSPLSDSSTSSIDSKLVIVSDNEEMKDLESMPLIPKRRGRKRKSESSSSSPTNSTETYSTTTPCKRSARLLAKRIVRDEQKTIQQNLPLFTYLGKYTKCYNRENKEAMESKKEQSCMMEEHANESECNKISVPVMGYFRECTDDGKIEKCSEEQNQAIKDDDLTKNNLNENTEDSLQRTTTPPPSSPLCVTSPTRNVDISITQILSSFSSPPASPTPLDNVCVEDQPIKEIPLERSGENFLKQHNKTLIYNLIRNYGIHQYRPHNSNQIKEHEKAEVTELEAYLKEFLTLNAQSEDAAVQLVSQVLSTTQNPKLIAYALCSSIQVEPRPPTTSYENFKNTEAPLLNRLIPSTINQKITYVISQLTQRQPEFSKALLIVIESILFSVQSADTISIDAALNLTDLYLLTLQTAPLLTENPARHFIAKCLYYHKVKAIPMIYAVLCVFPTTLPHREEHNYDRSDALITVIQHTLMCTKYDMENHQLYHREMLSKLRFVYRFEVFKPDFQHVLQNLLEKLRAGKLNNLKYAFAIFCKRLLPDRVVRDIIQPHLIPLSNEYYSILQQTTEYDERTAALLDCFSSVIKPFPRDTTSSIAAEINNYLNIFIRFLSVVERPIVQEAAVHAILRLQRFSYIICYNALASFRPDYVVQPLTRAALQTFIHRKPLNFWKTLLNQSG